MINLTLKWCVKNLLCSDDAICSCNDVYLQYGDNQAATMAKVFSSYFRKCGLVLLTSTTVDAFTSVCLLARYLYKLSQIYGLIAFGTSSRQLTFRECFKLYDRSTPCGDSADEKYAQTSSWLDVVKDLFFLSPTLLHVFLCFSLGQQLFSLFYAPSMFCLLVVNASASNWLKDSSLKQRTVLNRWGN